MFKSMRGNLRPDSTPAATPRLGLNRLCNLEDWNDPVETEYMRQLLPHFVTTYPAYPKGFEHRKHWEYGHAIRGLQELGVVRPDSWALSVAGGREEPAFYLT